MGRPMWGKRSANEKAVSAANKHWLIFGFFTTRTLKARRCTGA
ncbi:MAG: hypothetical protein ACI95C_001110 [Pseudohongiellaceae bacterium]|jgi:hypothetical protein